MKWIVFLVFVTLYGVASAQPGPGREGPRFPDREQFERDRLRPLSCWEWRRDAQRHPCVRVPRRCRGF